MPDELISEEPLVETNTISGLVQQALTEPHSLFIINTILDITENISVPSYKVNLLDGYDEWTDSNKITHRDITHKKVEGTFDMIFLTQESFLSFLAALKLYKKQNGSYDCSVYCVNHMGVINGEMFIDVEPADILPYLGEYKEYEKLTVTVKQRGNQYIL